jgi:hypothetical protein
VNIITIVVTAKRANRSPRPANRQQSLPNLNPPLEPSYNKTGCDSDSNIKLNNTKSDKDNKELGPIKRKRLSLSQDSLMYKKPKHRL